MSDVEVDVKCRR